MKKCGQGARRSYDEIDAFLLSPRGTSGTKMPLRGLRNLDDGSTRISYMRRDRRAAPIRRRSRASAGAATAGRDRTAARPAKARARSDRDEGCCGRVAARPARRRNIARRRPAGAWPARTRGSANPAGRRRRCSSPRQRAGGHDQPDPRGATAHRKTHNRPNQLRVAAAQQRVGAGWPASPPGLQPGRACSASERCRVRQGAVAGRKLMQNSAAMTSRPAPTPPSL